ncbi:MoxR family ATPase [bacterium]|nr:MoxR family ATPase [bacterium]
MASKIGADPNFPADAEVIDRLAGVLSRLSAEVGKVFFGQELVVEAVVVGLLSRGHILLEGVPGLGKTLLVKTLAQVLDLSFSRIQFTPDLMPTDITGADVIEEEPETGRRRLRFLPGPVFCNLLLADEINRTPPKTQSALLEAMQEQQVTAGTQRYPLDPPFFVLATQNPIEQEGTYPLPEAQLDRFMFNLRIGYPSEAEEIEIALRTTVDGQEQPRKVLMREEILAAQALVRRTPVDRETAGLAARLVRATRPGESSCPEKVRRWVRWGAGPRALQYLILAAKARALLSGRPNVSREDLAVAAPAVLRHRLVRSFTAEAENVSTDAIVGHLLEKMLPA